MPCIDFTIHIEQVFSFSWIKVHVVRGTYSLALVHSHTFMFYPSPYLFLIRVPNFLVMKGHNVNAVVVAEVQGAMLLEVLVGAGVVDTVEDTVNDLSSCRCGCLFPCFGTTYV